MALRTNANGQGAARTTGLVATSSNYTCMVWLRITALVGVGKYRTAFAMFNDPAYTVWAGIWTANNSNNYSLQVTDGVTALGTATFTMVLGAWAHFTYVRNGTTHSFYVNGALIGSITLDISSVTFNRLVIGFDGFSEDNNTSWQEFREWNTNLTAAEIATEALASAAVKTANLQTDTPLVADYLDDSGNGHDWTAQGAPTFVAVLWPHNLSPELAIPVTLTGTTPYANVQTVDSEGLTYSVWYKHTATAIEMIGGWGFGDLVTYRPVATVFITNGTVVWQVEEFDGTDNNKRFLWAEQSIGTTYWIKFTPNAGNPTPATLTVDFQRAPANVHQVGDIFVSPDVNSPSFAPGTVYHPTTDYTVRRFVLPFPLGEGGDILANGKMLFPRNIVGVNDFLDLFDPQFVLIGSVPWQIHASHTVVRTCLGTQRFFAADPAVNGLSFRTEKIDDTPASLQTWTVSPTVIQPLAIAASNDEGILYYSDFNGGGVSIRRFNLNTSTIISNLVGPQVGFGIRDMLVLADDSIVATYQKGGPPAANVKRYDPSGSTLNTYTVPDFFSDLRLAYAIEPDHFWTWHHVTTPDILGTSHFRKIRVSDGAVITDVQHVHYSFNIYSPAATASPLGKFGYGPTCPFVILRVGAPAPVEDTRRVIRRLRAAPHISAEQSWLFYYEIMVDLETGVGIPIGQGEDPQLMLRWSDDGAHTWSSAYWVTAGRTGDYSWRAVWRRLGRSRDRVFEIVVSDPVKWRLLDVYLTVKPGRPAL